MQIELLNKAVDYLPTAFGVQTKRGDVQLLQMVTPPEKLAYGCDALGILVVIVARDVRLDQGTAAGKQRLTNKVQTLILLLIIRAISKIDVLQRLHLGKRFPKHLESILAKFVSWRRNLLQFHLWIPLDGGEHHLATLRAEFAVVKFQNL